MNENDVLFRDTGILGKRKSEFSYQDSNPRHPISFYFCSGKISRVIVMLFLSSFSLPTSCISNFTIKHEQEVL